MGKYTEYRKFAVAIAKEAGRILMKYRNTDSSLEHKPDHSPVTQADTEAEAFIRKAISDTYSEHGIIGEEEDAKHTASSFVWVIDPMDGTIPFVRGTSDHFGVSIALAIDNIPVVGVVCAPARNELYEASLGDGAYCNNRPISVSDNGDLARTFIGVDYGKVGRGKILPAYEKIMNYDGLLYPLTFAGFAVTMALVANGGREKGLDGCFALNLDPWDTPAGAVLIREAGGIVTNGEGDSYKIGDISVVAGNAVFHKNFMELLR